MHDAHTFYSRADFTMFGTEYDDTSGNQATEEFILDIIEEHFPEDQLPPWVDVPVFYEYLRRDLLRNITDQVMGALQQFEESCSDNEEVEEEDGEGGSEEEEEESNPGSCGDEEADEAAASDDEDDEAAAEEVAEGTPFIRLSMFMRPLVSRLCEWETFDEIDEEPIEVIPDAVIQEIQLQAANKEAQIDLSHYDDDATAAAFAEEEEDGEMEVLNFEIVKPGDDDGGGNGGGFQLRL